MLTARWILRLSVVLAVRRRGDTSIEANVRYATRDNSAKAGIDYTAENELLNFAPFEIAKTITIPILDNGRVENDDRTFSVLFENPAAGAS